MVIEWIEPNDNGSTILSYVVYWDSGNAASELIELVGSPSQLTTTTFTISDAIQAGTSYQFKVKANNKWGSGLFSDVITVLAASPPSKIEPAAVTTIDVATGNVIITWTEPDNHGAILDSYLIQIRNQLGAWVSPVC